MIDQTLMLLLFSPYRIEFNHISESMAHVATPDTTGNLSFSCPRMLNAQYMLPHQEKNHSAQMLEELFRPTYDLAMTHLSDQKGAKSVRIFLHRAPSFHQYTQHGLEVD